MIADIGFILSLLASIIALWGVYLFNQRRDYTAARTIWFWSNTIFVVYFAGRILAFWNGGIGDVVMFTYFLMMWASNAMGMK